MWKNNNPFLTDTCDTAWTLGVEYIPSLNVKMFLPVKVDKESVKYFANSAYRIPLALVKILYNDEYRL